MQDHTVEEGLAEYPKLARLLTAKDEMVRQRATPPMYLKADLKTFDFSRLGTKFDVILIDPPWEEYARRAAPHAVGGNQASVWSYEDLERLPIEELGQ